MHTPALVDALHGENESYCAFEITIDIKKRESISRKRNNAFITYTQNISQFLFNFRLGTFYLVQMHFMEVNFFCKNGDW